MDTNEIDLPDVVWDKNIRNRQSYNGKPMVTILKYAKEKPKIMFSKAATRLILGTNTSLSIMMGLGTNNSDLYIKVCNAEEPGARPLTNLKSGSSTLSIASIGKKIGAIEDIKFTGELVTIHRDMYMVELKMLPRNTNPRAAEK